VSHACAAAGARSACPVAATDGIDCLVQDRGDAAWRSRRGRRGWTSQAAFYQAISPLQEAGVLIPLSHSRRNQVWEAAGLLDLIADFEAGQLPPLESDWIAPARSLLSSRSTTSRVRVVASNA
jgi:hypothetical protein